jgi:glyoxylase-like metal-dependent hydrolase (beta-lactamase superfamily II)
VLDDFDDPVFVNASYMIGQAEWEYWTDPATVESIGKARAAFAVGAARRLAEIEDQLSFIAGGQEVLPGILAHDSPGHTPGHMAFEVRHGSEAVMVVGDAIGNGHLALARPDWPSGSDQDAETGSATRAVLAMSNATTAPIASCRRSETMRALLVLLCLAAPALASEDIPDKYPGSPLYNKPVEVIPGVWSAIGATAPPTYENAGHNNNLSFIVTGEGVVVVNSGASYALAEALHAEIRNVTEEPVRLVLTENGQGHAMLGNGYWVDQGVPVIAHMDAAEEFADQGGGDLAAAQRVTGDQAARTRVEPPTETFEEDYIVEMGDFRIEARHHGPAHSPGDVVVWLPRQNLVISGDMAFHERMLPIFENTITADWLET